nr:ribonuclease H-like domain-containing protein [Tanacetum cinerariifolium]
MHRNITWDKVENPNPQSTPQVPLLFEEYTPPVTYPEEVEKTSGTSIEVEPLNEIKLEEVGLNCNHNTPLSSREVPSFDGPEPKPLLNCPSLDVSLGDVIGPEPPIKTHSPDSSRRKVVDYLTTQTSPSPHVANSHPKGVYSYYIPGTDMTKVTKKWPKPNKNEHEIVKSAQKPDPKTFLCFMDKITSRTNVAILSKMKRHELFSVKEIYNSKGVWKYCWLRKEFKLIQAWDEKKIESWSLPELLLQLLNDSRTIDEILKQREQAANLAVQQEQEEQAAQIFTPYWNFSMINDDEEHSIQYKEYLENSLNAITTVLPTEEPEYSLSMGYKHLSTISETKSDEVIEYSVKNLVQIPSEYEVTSDDESDDDESLFNEDVSMENFKVYSNTLFDDEEINSNEIDPHYFNAESDLIESLSNRDTLFDSSLKFDYLEELSGELMPTSIVNEERIKREHEEYISLKKKLFTINSFPRPLENFHANTIIETFPTCPIPVEDSESIREEIDIFTGTDDLMPPGIESDDYYSEGDIHFLENYLVMITFPFLKLSQRTLIIMMIPVMNNIDELNEDECFDPGEERLILLKGQGSPGRNKTPGPWSAPIPILLKGQGSPGRNKTPGPWSAPIPILLKGQGSPGRNKTPGPWSARIPMWQLFKGLRGMDMTKVTKKWPKPDKNEHEIAKSAQKPDPKTFLSGRMRGCDWRIRVSGDQRNTSSQRIYTENNVKETQQWLDTDCHAGNP